MKSPQHPPWLTKKAPDPFAVNEMERLIDGLSLHTVCEEAHCPNQGECFMNRTATFLIMGDVCTRNCAFCAINKGHPEPLDPHEPYNIAQAVKALNLKHTVITSVTRDDLKDGGAAHYAQTIEAVHKYCSGVTIEVLIPDFKGSREALESVIAARPEIVNHNVETVYSLYPKVRPQADYDRSLTLLQTAKAIAGDIVTKSGFMLGLGETSIEVIKLIKNLKYIDCDCLTIGQYLQPSPHHYPVNRYILPSEFDKYHDICMEMGFKAVSSGVFVRSSYDALTVYENICNYSKG